MNKLNPKSLAIARKAVTDRCGKEETKLHRVPTSELEEIFLIAYLTAEEKANEE